LKLNKASTFKDYKVMNYPCEVYLQSDDGLYFLKEGKRQNLIDLFPTLIYPSGFKFHHV